MVTLGKVRLVVLTLAVLLAGFASLTAHSPVGPTAASAHVSGAAHCDAPTRTAVATNAYGQTMFTYRYTVNFCQNGSTITALNTSRAATPYNGWAFVGHVSAQCWGTGYFKQCNTVGRFTNGHVYYDASITIDVRADGHNAASHAIYQV